MDLYSCVFLFSVVSAMNKTVANSRKHDSVWSSTYRYPSQVPASAVRVHLTKWIILLNNANRGDLKHTLMGLESVICASTVGPAGAYSVKIQFAMYFSVPRGKDSAKFLQTS